MFESYWWWSPVVSAMLNSDIREAKEGEVKTNTINSNSLSSMIHLFQIYPGNHQDRR